MRFRFDVKIGRWRGLGLAVLTHGGGSRCLGCVHHGGGRVFAANCHIALPFWENLPTIRLPYVQ